MLNSSYGLCLQVSSEQLSSDGHTSPQDTDHSTHLTQGLAHKEEEGFDFESGLASVFVYKRENEKSADILQSLIGQDPRQFRCDILWDRLAIGLNIMLPWCNYYLSTLTAS